MSWRRFAALVRNLPRESATVRAVGGAQVEWDVKEYMLATIIDLLAAGNWQRAGNKNRARPKPVLRPGEVDNTTERFGQGRGVPIDEFNQRLALMASTEE